MQSAVKSPGAMVGQVWYEAGRWIPPEAFKHATADEIIALSSPTRQMSEADNLQDVPAAAVIHASIDVLKEVKRRLNGS